MMRKVVIKVGTNSISKDGRIDLRFMRDLVRQLAALKDEGYSPMLISSGAIGCGALELGLKQPIRKLEEKQAAASVGQGMLMEHYRRLFSKHSIKVAQVLLTYEDFSRRTNFVNLKRSIDTLLRMGVVPIVNENDAISIHEIDRSFGDNDTLSALVASKIEADLLIMLTTTDGLYDRNPKRKDAKLLRIVEEITPEIKKNAGKASLGGRGGMRSKVEAADMAMQSGIQMVVANSKEKDAVLRIAAGEDLGTMFVPKEKASNKKRWIKFTRPAGTLVIDDGARKALERGKSLLPAGIKDIKGSFHVKDVVEIVCSGRTVGKAIADYSSEELERIKGRHSDEIENILGYKSYEAVFRRENFIGG